MKVVSIKMDLVIEDKMWDGTYPLRNLDKEIIANYLNNKLYTDPEFFGDFGPENIVEIKEWE